MAPIPSQQAVEETQNIRLYPGRQSIINFENGQRIYFIQLADITRVVYSTDVPIETGQARSVILRPIYPLRLERPTLSSNGRYPTNITVGTMGEQGRQLYTFNVVVESGRTTDVDGLTINIPPPPEPTPNDSQIVIAEGQTASLSDVEVGIRVALRQGYTPASDPILPILDEFLAIARQGNTPLPEVAQAVGLNFQVVIALAELGLEEATNTPRLIPLEPTISPQQEEANDPDPSSPKQDQKPERAR
jgi:hypothetical protein